MNTVKHSDLIAQIAKNFVANCDIETINHVKQNPSLRLLDIDADEVLYEYNEFDYAFDSAIDNDGLEIEILGDFYCQCLNQEFLSQHNLVVQFR